MAGMRLYALESNDPGQLGPYAPLRRIATGGMGRIYLARQQAPGTPAAAAGPTGTVVDHRIVAVKTLLAEGFVSKPDRERFAREVELAGRVDSAWTAKVLDADAEAERPWLAIEFIAAPSLAELVVSAGTASADAIRRLAAGAARALAELHALGVVHRDIKPQNILLPHDGPRLIDFGISHAHDHTSSTTTIGTFSFTSPEQASGRKSTAASDMYSLGATLFFLAVGRAPYEQTDHSIGVLALVQRGELDTSGLPPELEPLVLPLLAADPADRPSPSDLLQGPLAGATGAARGRDAGRWLPEAWTALIEEYVEQGRQLRDGTLDLTAAEAPTQVRSDGTPGSDETLHEMREQLEALRKQRDALVRAQEEEQAEAAARELARKEEEAAAERRARRRRERERAEREEREKRERKERKEKREAEEAREAKEKAAREKAAKEKAAREKLARERTATAAKKKNAVPPSAPKAGKVSAPTSKPSTTPKKPGSSDGAGGVIVVIVLILAVLFWHPWSRNDDDTTPASNPTPRFTLSTSGGSDDSLGGDSPSDTSGDDTDDSDTGSDTDPEPETSSPEPEPDATEDAFKAVSYGDCLDVVDTGYGGLKKYDWSEEEPNTTPCGAGSRVAVTGTTGDCDTGVGRATWSYYSTSSGERTSLCLTGRYRQGDCLLAKLDNRVATSIAMLSSPTCSARRVPAAYNTIFVITDVYRATPGSGTESCRHGQYDRNTYWSTKVDGGATLLCLKVSG